MAMARHFECTFALVIPTYNRAHLICETLESALSQSKSFSEIIVVDDGSTDNTSAVLRQYEGRITIIQTENNGVQAARNLGIRSARSDYVTLCDSDDLLEPDFLQLFSQWLSANPSCDVLYCNFNSFDKNKTFGDRLAYAPPGLYSDFEGGEEILAAIPDLILRIVQFQILFVSGMTLRCSKFDVIGEYNVMFNGIGAEDFEFTMRAVSRANIAFCKRPLVRVRRHEGNASVDQVRQVSGEIQILEYALEHNDAVSKYRSNICTAIDERRLQVFDAGFARGDFELASTMLKTFRKLPSNWRFQIKKRILNLPSLFRGTFWRLTQI
ncbi:glycosyltransferase family 2 protein [Massilia sp. R2A-15]|uniref:glycosyltransferase family 2 protein n=1 Tax=Massilia sp. R2A-15 TaxID=3064278 RepID=UPI00273640B8|nr:glycosyltransferase family 2 protein [Massilia sp. R2A-15]WLI88911.1 glycosyltransferase family 2 protein [Massilia sp. R2A-15]